MDNGIPHSGMLIVPASYSKLRYFFILQSLTTSKMRKFKSLKLSQFQKAKTCWTENWDYEQLFRGVFLCFGGQKKVLNFF